MEGEAADAATRKANQDADIATKLKQERDTAELKAKQESQAAIDNLK
jgi:hypothetical protein